MRKISRLNCFRIMLSFLMLMPLVLKGQTVSPRNGSTIQQLSEINITFSSNVVLQNIDGISIGLGNQYLPPWDKPGEYGFTVTTQGNQATIKLDNPYSNLYNFEQWGTFYCEEGTFLVGGSPSSEIGAEWTFSPSIATIPEPVISPARGSMNLSLSEITIEWPGCGVEIVGNEWDLEEVKFGIKGSNYSHANIASIETAGDAGSLGNSKVVIKVQNSKDGNKPFTAKGTYVLNLEQGIVRINATDGSAMFPGDEFTFFISDYMVSPKNMSKITNFEGLTIGGGNIEIKDPSLIKLYLGYYDGVGESVPSENTSPIASGTNVIETTLDGVPAMNVSFGLNEPLYNGAYSIYIPANAILSDGKGINEGNSLYVTFTIEGNMKPLPEWTAEPAPGKVTSLSTVSVAWGKKRSASNALENFYGDFLTLTNDAGYVPVILELPNGTKNQLMGVVRIVTDNNEDVDQAARLGAYLYIMLGNSYSADGVYTLTIPAGTLTVDVDNHNHVPIENTVITYVIGDGNITDPDPEAKDIHIAFATEGTDIGSNTISSRNDPLMERQADGSYLYEYELNAKSPKNFGFMVYYEEGNNYMSIGKAQKEGSSYGADEQITLPNVPGEKAEYTFTNLGQYSVGFAGYGMQSTFTFTNPGGFVEGTATLKLSADLQTLEVLVTTEGSSEPGIQLPEMIANPVDGSTLRNVFAAEPAIRWGENRLRIVNSKGFSVIRDNGNKNITSDFILQLTEYCPNETTSLEDVQAVISYTDIWPLDNGSYTYTFNAGAIQINYNGQWVDCPEIVLHYTLGAQQTVTLPPATIVPEDGSKVTDLKNVTLSWPAFYVQQRGDGEGGMLKNITYTVNGGSPKVIDVTYEGNEAPGMEGYYSTIVLPINAKESGKYVVTVPAGALYVASENAGSLENEEIVLTYDVTVTETPAPVYMTGGSVDPRDGSRLANMGDVYITWGNYTLDINPEPNKDYVNLPIDKVTATLNGEKVNLNNMFGVIFRAINTQGSDEGTGGTSTFHVAEIQFYPGDLSFYWSGTLNLKFEEGLVKSTTGAISPAFDLTYYLGGQEVVSPAIFTPEEGSKFLPGEAVVYVAWEGYNVTAINGGVTLNTMNEEGDVGSSTSISNSQLSIEGGKLKIDLTSLPAGSYQMWLHQGAVDLGNNAVNADAPYAFSIALPEPEGPEATDIDPAINIADGKITISWDGNEIEQTDDFNLTIIDNTTGEEVNIWDGVVSVDENGNLVIDLESLELPEGDYTLTLAEGSVNIDEDGTITYNNEVTYNFKTSAVGIVAADADVRYFTINGVEVKNPAAGQILIRVEGNKVTKVLVK